MAHDFLANGPLSHLFNLICLLANPIYIFKKVRNSEVKLDQVTIGYKIKCHGWVQQEYPKKREMKRCPTVPCGMGNLGRVRGCRVVCVYCE